ncbi:hypothetical protein [Pseudomonas fluorescens]|uniref:hypothetical protein n=1 Tax=Pseudomonas fluorescens TaxID=294 RepID=UPI00123F4099|nr:hypothetical protein [Pseudomonas fluorescens]
MNANKEYSSQITEIETMYSNNREKVYTQLPAPGYWIPMLLSAAVKKGNGIVDNIQKYSSPDHGVNFRALLVTISQSHAHPISDFQPFFDEALKLDDQAKHVFTYESDRLMMLHDKTSAEEGIWHVTRHADSAYKIELSPASQRTALHLLSVKADFLSSSNTIRKFLKHPGKDSDFVGIALQMKLTDLKPITAGTAKEWMDFLQKLELTEEELIIFQLLGPFIQQRVNRFWFKEDDLVNIVLTLNKQYKLTKCSKVRVQSLLKKLVPTLEEALEWGLSVPFVKIGDWYMWWPFAYSVIHPNLTLLAILMKRSPEHWNNTIGSQAAKVSDYLAGKLKKSQDIEITTCRVKKNIGDIDIAIFNNTTNTLLLCEVKTVFDRFRTNHQHKNFTMQRVNYQKAANQLLSTQQSIESGNWKIKDIFPSTKASEIKKILKIVLTWWDIFDPYKGTDFNDVAVSNFSTFIYAYNQCNSNLEQLHQSLLELSALPCPATRLFNAIDDGGFELKWSIDKQCDLLPPDADARCIALSPFSSQLLTDIQRFPKDWKSQMLALGEDIDTLIFP